MNRQAGIESVIRLYLQMVRRFEFGINRTIELLSREILYVRGRARFGSLPELVGA